MESAQRQQRLEALRSEPDWQKRRLVALALLGDALASEGITPVVVGGAALELYTAGGYSTKDVDLALPISPFVDAAFADLGFLKEGRYWYRDDLDLLFEAPDPAGLPGETAPRTVVEVEGLPVVVIGVADLLIDRLRAWVHWESTEDRRWATRLAVLYRDQLDWAYLAERTAGDPAEAEALALLEREVGR